MRSLQRRLAGSSSIQEGVELSMAFDGIHLSENGHKALAKVFAEQIFEGRDKSYER